MDRHLVTVHLAESSLASLVRRDMVTAMQFAAGERLRGDFMRVGQAPRMTMNWDPAPTRVAPGGGHDLTTAQLGARQRFDAAVMAVGPELSDVLGRVACRATG